jgi:hypothetical protein
MKTLQTPDIYCFLAMIALKPLFCTEKVFTIIIAAVRAFTITREYDRGLSELNHLNLYSMQQVSSQYHCFQQFALFDFAISG